jgi:hypothetical protein
VILSITHVSIALKGPGVTEMSLWAIKLFYFPLLIAISISKPISDYFWLREFNASWTGIKAAPGDIIRKLNRSQYISLVVTGLLLWALSAVLWLVKTESGFLTSVVLALGTGVFILNTVLAIRSILVVALCVITFANFEMIMLFHPLTTVSDLSTLNSFLSLLISVFNYAALATFGLGLVWKYSRHNDENVYSTISTMFYAVAYIGLNMFAAFITLFVPTVNRITELAG